MATKGKVSGIVANMVVVKTDGAVSQNEICHVDAGGGIKLMAEVIKVIGDEAYIQVFDSTRGLSAGAAVDFAGHMLEVTLAPGMLSKSYDGLQNDLEKMSGTRRPTPSTSTPGGSSRRWPRLAIGSLREAGWARDPRSTSPTASWCRSPSRGLTP